MLLHLYFYLVDTIENSTNRFLLFGGNLIWQMAEKNNYGGHSFWQMTNKFAQNYPDFEKFIDVYRRRFQLNMVSDKSSS